MFSMKMKFIAFKWVILAIAIALMLNLAACGQVLNVLGSAAETMPTPVPLVVTPEPVITYSDVTSMPLPEGQEIPTAYTRVETSTDSNALFAFTGPDGAVQYRVFGGYTVLQNGVAGEEVTGFYPSDETGAILSETAEMVDPAVESLGTCISQPLPETLRLRSQYQALENGAITDGAGNYYIYGSIGQAEGAFYPSDENGIMIPGALASTVSIAVPSYAPDTVPAADGERMIVVYIGTQSVVVYVAKDGEWTEERVMICSTGRSKLLTPRGTFAIMRQYLYKKMGQVDGENVYSQYASRITGSYLFHSVPIGGDKRYLQEYGKTQMFVKYYERLGTFASGGCVRLRCIDAYWIYMNCPVGTTVTITDDNGPTPPTPPELIYEEPYMDAKHEYGWDPSDPDPENPYHAVYTPEVVLDGPVTDKSKTD
ncbi:MAG: L,D-transpeptidase [Eubacteriales bacterium]|nr:L,D-transpeptidase [Eubacteriales bacterium]